MQAKKRNDHLDATINRIKEDRVKRSAPVILDEKAIDFARQAKLKKTTLLDMQARHHPAARLRLQFETGHDIAVDIRIARTMDYVGREAVKGSPMTEN